jgi:Lon protease-like protein
MMEKKPHSNQNDLPENDLPQTLPIFPLSGALLLPGGQLPLHIFEPRYKAMVNDAIAGSRMIGMIQSFEAKDGSRALYEVGCVGKIKSFEELEDGRFFITLHGVCRFHVKEELDVKDGYRRITPDWSAFKADLAAASCLDLDRTRLHHLLGGYFASQSISCDWEAIEQTEDQKLITCLAMICPFSESEKQALLEAPCCRTRADLFMSILEMAVLNSSSSSQDNDAPPARH